VQIDAVQQRASDLPEIPLYDSPRAAALPRGIRQSSRRGTTDSN
jgi:hypothetical protein